MCDNKPTRCIDPVIKFCQECEWGCVHYPEWVETADDLAWCRIESGCSRGYDRGRPEDEPTAEELEEFNGWCNRSKQGYCPICDDVIYVNTGVNIISCPTCGHHINLHEVDDE